MSRKLAKGIAHILILIIIVVLGIGTIGYFAYKNDHASSNPASISNSNNLIGWQTYQNYLLGVEFKYPPTYVLLENKMSNATFGVRGHSDSNNLLPLLYLSQKYQIDFDSLINCPQPGGVWPCFSVGNKTEDIQIGGVPAKSFYISNEDFSKYHVIQIPNPQIEIRMEIGDGRERIFDQILHTFKFLPEHCKSGCPQFMPPHPDFCKDGKIVSGEVNECGCQLPPVCKK